MKHPPRFFTDGWFTSLRWTTMVSWFHQSVIGQLTRNFSLLIPGQIPNYHFLSKFKSQNKKSSQESYQKGEKTSQIYPNVWNSCQLQKIFEFKKIRKPPGFLTASCRMVVGKRWCQGSLAPSRVVSWGVMYWDVYTPQTLPAYHQIPLIRIDDSCYFFCSCKTSRFILSCLFWGEYKSQVIFCHALEIKFHLWILLSIFGRSFSGHGSNEDPKNQWHLHRERILISKDFRCHSLPLRNVGLRVFCVGNSCFLRRWLVLVFFATVPVGGVFCNGGGCFLRRSWWEGMFFATAGHVFCIGRVCFLRRWCFLRR